MRPAAESVAGATAHPAREPLLSIRDLEVRFGSGSRPVLQGISLDVAPGERVAIVGQSGSGKSTTIGAVLQLLAGGGRITAGSIRLAGQELAGAGEAAMRSIRGSRIGLVPQDPMSNLNPAMKVGAQVADALAAGVLRGAGRAKVKARAVQLMGEAGIPDAANRYGQYPHEFSGGMRQRVLIAIALAGEPELIIADEPTSALDVTVQRQILGHLQQLVERRGTSLLFITHDLGLAADRTDRIIVMADGRIVEQGPPRQILLQPREDYTRRLVAAAPSVTALLGSAAGAAGSAASRIDGERTDTEEAARTGADDAGPATGPGPEAAAGTERSEPAVRIDSLVKDYRLRGRRGQTVQALRGISFDVAHGTTTAVVGESGSGKTTLARILLGLEEPTSGRALIRGRSVADARGAERRTMRRMVQPVFQDPYGSLDPTYSVERLIDEPLRVFGIGSRESRRHRVEELLDQVALPRSIAQRRPGELSGGQRQRVAIARALAPAPELLICDEAVSALDVLVQDQILGLLADLQQRLGLTYLFITHDLAVVRQIAHKVVVMKSGAVVERGAVEQVFEAPAHEYTRELLAAIPGAAFAA